MTALAKHLSKKLWSAYFTNENKVWYMIASKSGGIIYKTIDEIDDLSNMLVFNTQKEAMTFVQWDIKDITYPNEATDVEVEQGYLTRESEKLWFDCIQLKRYTLKEALQWH